MAKCEFNKNATPLMDRYQYIWYEYNMMSVTGEGWDGAGGTLLLLFQVPELVW